MGLQDGCKPAWDVSRANIPSARWRGAFRALVCFARLCFLQPVSPWYIFICVYILYYWTSSHPSQTQLCRWGATSSLTILLTPNTASTGSSSPESAWKWGSGCFNETIPSETQIKMWIKPRESFLYQWFSTQSISKGILKVKGELAKPCLWKSWNIHLPIKQTPSKCTGSCSATSGQLQLSFQWMTGKPQIPGLSGDLHTESFIAASLTGFTMRKDL